MRPRNKLLHLGCGNPRRKYRLEELIDSSLVERDLGVLVNERLDMNHQHVLPVQKTNCVLGCIIRGVTSGSREVIVPLFSAFVRPPPGVLHPGSDVLDEWLIHRSYLD